MRIVTLGPAGTHSERAARLHAEDAEVEFADSIPGVFELVGGDGELVGVVPVENSIEGVVTRTLDLLRESDLRVVGEVVTEIRHHLVGSRDPEVVASHSQALAQCRHYLEENLPGVEVRTVDSTSRAVELAASRENVAAIGTEEAAERHGLPVVARDVQDVERNVTRFVVIGRGRPEPTGDDRTTVAFFVEDKPGALHHALRIFYRHGVNLTMLESRPARGELGDYYFFADLEGHRDDREVAACLDDLADEVKRLEVLGSYPRSPEY
ncbi:MAG: Prephenate dehydratase [Methanonatronarchaeales archaeon]|nr:Prephenate dehydratase [Methanonatronarchaeales archaeon]